MDRYEARQRREYDKAVAAKKKLAEKLAELDRKAREAKNKLMATTKHEHWHCRRLAWLDRQAGYDGEMASARVWLRNLPLNGYVDLLAPFAASMPHATNLEVEFAAVQAHLEEWTVNGDALLLDRAKRAYAEEVDSFREWQRNHSNDTSWRTKRSTRAQWFLIARTAQALGIETPARLNRGEAHDWLERYGGNQRLVTRADGAETDFESGGPRKGHAAIEASVSRDLREEVSDWSEYNEYGA